MSVPARRAVPDRAVATEKPLQRLADDREASMDLKAFISLVLREGPPEPPLQRRGAVLGISRKNAGSDPSATSTKRP